MMDDQVLTMHQAFQAMRCFVDQFKEREPDKYRGRFEQLIRWTATDGNTSDPSTADPAQWPDWVASVARALGPETDLP